ncbi:MAG: WD40 repeat domain-containing protein [Verrucomicrobia bacterium]|nr:WD40 repeat domain-containing protein [Verrucomicrobiota bacterium]
MYSLAFLPDGRTLACPFGVEHSTNGEVGVALWDVASQRITDRFTTTGGGFPVITVGHRGGLLAYVTGQAYDVRFRGKIVICDLTRTTAPFELVGHEASPLFPDLSPDGRWLATPHSDGRVILWDLDQRRERTRLLGHRGHVFVAQFAPVGLTLATAGIDGTVRLWDLRDLSGPIRSSILGYHHSTVFGLGFSPDAKLLVSASLDHTAKVWEVAAGKEIATLRGHDQRVFSTAFSPDGRFILTGSEDGTAKIWPAPEPAAAEPLHHHDSERYGALEFSADGRWLLAGETNRTLLWQVASRTRFTLDALRCRFSPTSNLLTGLTGNGELTTWRLGQGQPRRLAALTNVPPLRLDLEPAFSPRRPWARRRDHQRSGRGLQPHGRDPPPHTRAHQRGGQRQPEVFAGWADACRSVGNQCLHAVGLARGTAADQPCGGDARGAAGVLHVFSRRPAPSHPAWGGRHLRRLHGRTLG